jgi:hypothetical protein
VWTHGLVDVSGDGWMGEWIYGWVRGCFDMWVVGSVDLRNGG